MTQPRKPVDWEAIEREYRAGQLSVREIAAQHGVSHTAVNKRAKAHSWTRDLAKAVRRKVAETLVSSEVSEANAQGAVDTAAARGVELVRQHRRSLGRAQVIIEKLLAELERGTDNLDEIEATIEVDASDDAKRRNMMLKAVSLPSRAQTAAALSLTIKNVIPLERQAFSLDADPRGSGDETEIAQDRDISSALLNALKSQA